MVRQLRSIDEIVRIRVDSSLPTPFVLRAIGLVMVDLFVRTKMNHMHPAAFTE